MSSGPPNPDPGVVADLVPSGILRAGINLSNFLLVNGTDANGEPVGVSPSMAAALGEAVGATVGFVAFPNPGDVVDALESGEVDTGNIGADPARSGKVAFTPPYCEIEATYLVRGGSPVVTLADVDRPDVRIVSRTGAAYTLWLDRNIHHAQVVHTDTIDESFDRFVADDFEVLAGLRPRLLDDAARIPGSRILEGRFTSVAQAIGVNRDRGGEVLSYLERFVAWAIGSGLVSELIQRHRVSGLTVASRL